MRLLREITPSQIEQKVERLQTAARAAGIKLTFQRLEIFRELAGSEAHPDAETVFRSVKKRMPTVSIDTVYRTLWVLHDLGFLDTLGPQRGAVRFDANVAQHHHYVCVQCGLVRDFESESLNALRIPPGLKQFGTVVDSRVEVRGLCIPCQKNDVSKSKKTSRTVTSVKKRK